MASTLTTLLYHALFSTKSRLILIREDSEPQLHVYMGGIARANGGVALEIGGTDNHVHMLLKIKPVMAVAEIIRLIKTGSSKWMNERATTTNRFGWQLGYGAFTVSESQMHILRIYIKNQRSHHHKKSFDDELKILLKRHDIAYDPKYLLD